MKLREAWKEFIKGKRVIEEGEFWMNYGEWELVAPGETFMDGVLTGIDYSNAVAEEAVQPKPEQPKPEPEAAKEWTVWVEVEKMIADAIKAYNDKLVRALRTASTNYEANVPYANPFERLAKELEGEP